MYPNSWGRLGRCLEISLECVGRWFSSPRAVLKILIFILHDQKIGLILTKDM